MKNDIKYYSVGALLYCPANKKEIPLYIETQKFAQRYSLALCLEDSIGDACVEEAQDILISSIKHIYSSLQKNDFYVPNIFIRVRSPLQIESIARELKDSSGIVRGFIAPKFSLQNASSYIESLLRAENIAKKNFCFMPIYESMPIVDLRTRSEVLYGLKEKLNFIEEKVLNIRVGGNDLCHLFGFRRRADESIHNIRPIENIFSDIITVYGTDYVVSGPVWEYYSGAGWKEGLIREVKEDRSFGFIGKTVIHPSQIEVVNEEYKVLKKDAEDAKQILEWSPQNANGVFASKNKERMNEYKTHTNWAQQILYLAEAFGIKDA